MPIFRELLKVYDLMEGAAAEATQEMSRFAATEKAMRQSILKAAFEGRLVPQDPADESASILLARLRGGYSSNGARRRRARAAADVSHPSLPGLTGQPLQPRVGPVDND
jgi:type I restriction enzyme S subunit